MNGWLQAVAVGAGMLVASWLVLMVLAARLPPGVLRELAGFLPNCVKTARALRNDPAVPRRAKMAVGFAALWCLSPIDGRTIRAWWSRRRTATRGLWVDQEGPFVPEPQACRGASWELAAAP